MSGPLDHMTNDSPSDGSPSHRSSEKGLDKPSLLSVAEAALRRITNQGLLYAIVLFCVALAAVILLLEKPTTPTWVIVVAVFLLLLFVFYVAYFVGRPFFGERKGMDFLRQTDTLGAFMEQLDQQSEADLDSIRTKMRLPQFPADCDTHRKKVNYLIKMYPANMVSRKVDWPKMIGFSAATLLLLPLWNWYKSLPSAEEKAIRTFYDGINVGLSGDSNGWEQMWSVLSVREKAVRERVDPGSYPAHFRDTYDSPHSIRSVRFNYRNGESKPVYSVIYETREVMYPNPLNQWVNPSTHKKLKDFFGEFSSEKAIVEKIITGLKRAYDVRADGLEVKIRSDVSNGSFESVFRPNTLRTIGQRYSLPLKAQASRSLEERHYDVLWMFDIVLTKEAGAWKIDRFVLRGATFKEVNLEE